MRKLFTLAVSLSVMFLFLSLGAVNAAPEPDKVVTKDNSVNIESTEYYRQLYEDQKDYNDKILNTVYWALGGLATAVITVIGLNIFSNNRSNKTAIESIKQELLKVNEEFNNRTHSYLDQQLNRLKGSNSEQITQIVEKESKKIYASIEGLEINTKISIQRELLESFIYRYELESKISKIKQLLLEAEVYKLRKVLTTACRCLCDAATLQIEIGHTPNYSLAGILEILNSFTTISSTVIPEVSKLLKKIPLEHDSLRIKIEEKLNSLEIN